MNVGVKYRPPKLGIEFYLKNDENFNKSLNSKRDSFQSLVINDLDNFNEKLLVHEIFLDAFFFTKEAQIYGERSYDHGRMNQEFSPMKQRLSAGTITEHLYGDPRNKAFLNPKLIKFAQIQRLVQRMLDQYNNFYKERSASRERRVQNKENRTANTNQNSGLPNLSS